MKLRSTECLQRGWALADALKMNGRPGQEPEARTDRQAGCTDL